MPNTLVRVDLLQAETIRKKEKKTIIKQSADTRYQGQLRKKGDTVKVQIFPRIGANVSNTTGGNITDTSGNAIAGQQVTVANEDLKINQVYQVGTLVADIEEIQNDFNIASKIAEEFAQTSAQNEDEFVASKVHLGLEANKIGFRAPITLSTSNAYDNITQMTQALEEQNAFENTNIFINPKYKRFLKREDIFDSTEKGVEIRMNGFVGKIDGFRIFSTNNLPHVRLLSIAAQVTDNDTVTLAGLVPDQTTTARYQEQLVVFKAVTTATAAGDVAKGANVAAFQQNLLDAVNNTGTPGSGTYIAISASDRIALTNALVAMETSWTGNTNNVQSARTVTMSETFTDVTDSFGDDAFLIFSVDNKAINAVFQMDKMWTHPVLQSTTHQINHEKVYDGTVFSENNKGISSVEIKVT